MLRWAFRHRWLVVGATAAGIVAAGVAATTLPRAFLPPFNEGSLSLGLAYSPGISLAESHRLGLVAEWLIREVPEVTSVGRRTGRAEIDEHAEGVHSSEIDVDLKLGRPKEVILAELRERLSVVPAVLNVGQPISHRLDHMLSGIRVQIAVKIYGDDLDTLHSLAERLRDRLARIEGMTDLQVEKQVRIPHLRVDVDHERAALYGLTPAAVTEALASLSNGRTVSQIIGGNRRFDVVIRLDDEDRSTAGLGELLIPAPAARIPLRRVASVVETDGPNQIARENTQRRIAVFGNTDKRRDLAAVVADVRQAVEETRWPPGYRAGLEGTFQAQEEATVRIGLLSLVALALIFVVLYGRYRSSALALIIMGNVPLALIGSVVALWLAGQPLSVASMVGFITLTGITARNGILKVSHYLNLALHEGQAFGQDLVLRGSQERLTPVLMTALSAGLALLPLVIGLSEPGREILHPVAVTILGGLVSATLLDAVLTPILFLGLGRRPLARLQGDQDCRLTPTEAY